MKVVVGLGNPGKEYERDRHNIGFMVVDAFARKHGFEFRRRKFRSALAEGRFGSGKLLLSKPLTFMNLSGEAVAPLAAFYKLPSESLLVVADDLDIPLGEIRLRPKGGSGGHNGLKSIIEHLGTREFPRLRIGIGRPPAGVDPADYVLQPFSPEEVPVVDLVVERAVEAIETWILRGIETAMNEFNRKPIARQDD